MYDPPHASQNSRNNVFFRLYIQWEDYWWEIITLSYHYDKDRTVRLCPKLTEKHSYLEGFGARIKVKLAAHVLGHSTSAAIETMVELEQLSGPDRDRAQIAPIKMPSKIPFLWCAENIHMMTGQTVSSSGQSFSLFQYSILFKLTKSANCKEDIDRFVIEADSLADLQ